MNNTAEELAAVEAVATPFLSTPDEQTAYNNQVCSECELARWQHINAVLCGEMTEHQIIMQELASIKEDVAQVRSFIDQLEAAIKQHPMGKMLLG